MTNYIPVPANVGPSPVDRFIEFVTGAKRGEGRQVLFSFLSLNFLLVSYYMIKPLRNSQFLKHFDPVLLPWVYLAVPLVSLAVTKVFTYMADRMDKYRLIIGAYLLIMVGKVAFTFLLPVGGKAGSLLFFFFASTYFLLAIATTWACINDIFTSEQSERTFGFIAVGSTAGNILGAKTSGILATSSLKAYAPIVAAAAMGMALVCIMTAAKERRRQRELKAAIPEDPIPDEAEQGPVESPEVEAKEDFWGDVKSLWGDTFVRRIAIMVVCLAVYTTALDFLSNQVADQRLSERQYMATFVEVNNKLNVLQNLPSGEINPLGYEAVYKLKSASESERPQKMAELAEKAGVSKQVIEERYTEYRNELEGRTREFFSSVYFWQGWAGIFLLVVVARFVFAYVGMRFALILMPILGVISVIAFCFPVELVFVQCFLVLSGSMNYSLNNAAKEILYTSTSEETKFKHKPLIEGPGMRLGDVTASSVKLAILGGLGFLGFNQTFGDQVFLMLVLVLVLIWMRAIYQAGAQYDEMRKKQRNKKTA